MSPVVRPYDPDSDAEGLYRCKLAFERGLGEHTGGDEKAGVYEGKLTDGYRDRWLDWVGRCVDDDERCVTVAAEQSAREPPGSDSARSVAAGCDEDIVGYVFVLPERLAMIWDAAVINELYVAPEHRGTGVADDLMAAALDLARDQELPLDRAVLDVDPANERARAFYDRHGFDGWGEMVARPLDRPDIRE